MFAAGIFLTGRSGSRVLGWRKPRSSAEALLMPTTSGCPDPDQLELFVLGQVVGAQADLLDEHIAHCSRCLGTLASLPGVDPLVEAMRAAHEDKGCSDLVHVLIRQLKRTS